MKLETAYKLIEHNQSLYNKIAKDFSDTRNKIWPEFEYFKGYLENGQDILDVGCGNGRLLKLLSKFKINYLGIDNSAQLIQQAKNEWPDYQFEVKDLLNLPNLKQPFDLIISVATIHHLPSDELRNQVFSDIRKLLKPDGKFMMINWNLWQKRYLKYIIKYSLYKMSQPNKEVIPGVLVKDIDFQDVFMQFFQKKHKRYVHAFTEFNIASLLKKSGFEIIKNVSNKRNIITVARLLKK